MNLFHRPSPEKNKNTAATVHEPPEIKLRPTPQGLAQIRERRDNESLMKFIATQNHVDDYRELAVQYIHDQEALVRIFKNDPHPIVQENVIYNINQIDLLKDLKQFSKSPRVTTRINEKIQKLQNEADQKISEALNAFKEEATKDTPRWHVQQEMIGVVMSAATSSDQKFKILHELTDITRRMNDPHKNLLLLEIERRLEMSPEVQTFKSLEK